MDVLFVVQGAGWDILLPEEYDTYLMNGRDKEAYRNKGFRATSNSWCGIDIAEPCRSACFGNNRNVI